MALISILLALALEQWRPLVDRRAIFAPLGAYASFLERKFNAGEKHHGVIAWLLAMLPILLAGWLIFSLLSAVHPLLGLLFNVAVLYATMGFRQESHYFTDIHTELKAGNLDRARMLLGEWRGHDCEGLTTSEVVTLAIESALATSHRHVFGVIFWFVILPGPLGALLYRGALFLYHRWGERVPGHSAGLYATDAALGVETDFFPTIEGSESIAPGAASWRDRFSEGARTAFGLIDALPARFTAGSFAIVGNFEDAVYCWRTQAARWPDQLIGIVIAAGAGAIGIRLGRPIVRAGLIEDRPDLGVGEEADVPALDSTVGLVWRALVVWIAVLLVVSIAAGVT
jgi:adenosylcobinamide-phosphate synthase